MCLVNRRGYVDVQNLWIQEASKSGRDVPKKVGTSVTKPVPRSKIEQLMNNIHCEFMRTETKVSKCQSAHLPLDT